jgi:hypothetical protein
MGKNMGLTVSRVIALAPAALPSCAQIHDRNIMSRISDSTGAAVAGAQIPAAQRRCTQAKGGGFQCE